MVEQGNNINFFRGTKEKLLNNLNEMSDGDLAVAMDEMQWYMVIENNDEKELVLIGTSSNNK